jgi:hypothetical protein|tara:strand:- start:702 stop:1238 length:537 start_codon:yes stop_codon:yes gene_type:complete
MARATINRTCISDLQTDGFTQRPEEGADPNVLGDNNLETFLQSGPQGAPKIISNIQFTQPSEYAALPINGVTVSVTGMAGAFKNPGQEASIIGTVVNSGIPLQSETLNFSGNSIQTLTSPFIQGTAGMNPLRVNGLILIITTVDLIDIYEVFLTVDYGTTEGITISSGNIVMTGKVTY